MDALRTLLSTPDVARLLQITERQVQSLAAGGVLPKAERGRFRLGEVVHADAARREKEQKRKRGGDDDEETRKFRRAEAQARLDERIDRLKREAEAAAMELIQEAAGAVKSALASVAARSTRDIAMRATIEKEIKNALAAAAKQIGGAEPLEAAPPETVDAKPRKRAGRVGRKKSRVPAVKRKAGAA